MIELDWNKSYYLDFLEITFLPAQHWSGRWTHDRMATLWGAFALKTPYNRVYFAGDTGYGAHFAQAGTQFGPFDLALIPIGAYEPRWFMSPQHINPAEAVKAHADLRAQKSMAIHFGTFKLTYEGIDTPRDELAVAKQQVGLAPEAFVVPRFGETITLKSSQPADPLLDHSKRGQSP